ncbi:tetratricopeptide repeat protein [Flammeovirgaceae bacterium SG7u.111]|nr:tetratricopeptide repeat protein [Flammeovirgaceae bacterium SG7u.132]WPO34010.1 tetratricopeptide repeat protein [Flammeovirgaceae bacterium SG7u.111]
MKIILIYNTLVILLLVGLLAKPNEVEALSFNNIESSSDTLKIDELLAYSKKAFYRQQFELSLDYAETAFNLADSIIYFDGKVNSTILQGQCNYRLEKYDEAMFFYLRAEKYLLELPDKENEIRSLHYQIALLYQSQKNYPKAVEYYKSCVNSKEGRLEKEMKMNSLQNWAACEVESRNYDKAFTVYSRILLIFQKEKNINGSINTLNYLSTLAKLSNDFEKSMTYTEKVAEILETEPAYVSELSTTYNNLGFNYKRLEKEKKSFEYFQKSIDLANSIEDLALEQKATILNNVGVAHTNLKAFAKAKFYFNQALDLYKTNENEKGKAETLNYLAANYYISGNNIQAMKDVLSAIRIGESIESKKTLLTSYKLLSLIYLKEDMQKKAKEYGKKYSDLDEELKALEKERQEDMLKQQADANQLEEEIRELIQENERKSKELKKLALEAERRENQMAMQAKELDLAKRNQELQAIELKNQQLEKDRVKQLLMLTEQQFQAQQQDQQIALLEKNKELQEAEKKKKENAISLLQKDKELQDIALKEAERIKKYGIGIIGLALIIILMAVFGLIHNRKSRKKLEEKNAIINETNEELQVNQEMIAQQKEILEVENQKTMESIAYAKRIQNSILPSGDKFHNILPESFLIYKPKDIVSGDFYWASERDNFKFIAVVDCTGHGVPGALMSIMGNSILTEAIVRQKLDDPADILNYLNKNLIERLSSNDQSINDGMDVGFCILEYGEHETVKLKYAGAKHVLFVITGGELVQLKSDRLSIGGRKSVGELKSFNTRELLIHKGDLLYLTTDGYIDQNDVNRRRFGSKKFKDLIEANNSFSMEKQQGEFEEALDKHQEFTEQRDDITVIALKA